MQKKISAAIAPQSRPANLKFRDLSNYYLILSVGTGGNIVLLDFLYPLTNSNNNLTNPTIPGCGKGSDIFSRGVLREHEACSRRIALPREF